MILLLWCDRQKVILDFSGLSAAEISAKISSASTADDLKDLGVLRYSVCAQQLNRTFYAYANPLEPTANVANSEIFAEVLGHFHCQDLLRDYGHYFVLQACWSLAKIIGAETVDNLFKQNPFFFSRAVKIILGMGHKSGLLDFSLNYDEIKEIIPPDLVKNAMKNNLRDTVMAFFYLDYMGRTAKSRLRFKEIYQQFEALFGKEKFTEDFLRNPIDSILAFEQLGLDPALYIKLFEDHELQGKIKPSDIFSFSFEKYPELRNLRIPRSATAALDEAYLLFTGLRPQQSPMSVVDDTVAQLANLRDVGGRVIDIGKVNFLSLRVNNASDRLHGCPLKCHYCDQEGSEYEVNMEVWKKLIDYATEQGQRKRIVLNISGGEPTAMQDKLLELIRYAKGREMFISMNSNAVLINDNLARELVDAGLDNINVSLDSHIKDKNDEIVGLEGAYERVIAGLRFLNKWRNRRKSNLRISINSVLTSHNFRDFVAFVKYLGERIGHAIDDINPLPVKGDHNQHVVIGDKSTNLFLSYEQIKEFVEQVVPQVLELSDQYGFRLLGRKIQEIYGRTPEEWSRASKGIYYPRYAFPCYTSLVSLVAGAAATAEEGEAQVHLTSCAYRLDHLSLDPDARLGTMLLTTNSDIHAVRRAKLGRLRDFPHGEVCKEFCGPDLFRLNSLIAAKLAAEDRRADEISRKKINDLSQQLSISDKEIANLARNMAKDNNLPLARILTEPQYESALIAYLKFTKSFDLSAIDVYEACKALSIDITAGFDKNLLRNKAIEYYRFRKSESYKRMRLALDTSARGWITQVSSRLGLLESEVARLCRKMVKNENRDIGDIIRHNPDQILAILEFARVHKIKPLFVYQVLIRRGIINFRNYLELWAKEVIEDIEQHTATVQLTETDRDTLRDVMELADKYSMDAAAMARLLEKIVESEHLGDVRELLDISPDPIKFMIELAAEGYIEVTRDVSQALIQTSSLDKRIEVVLKGMQRIIGLSCICLSLIDKKQGVMLHTKAIDELGNFKGINLSCAYEAIPEIVNLIEQGEIIQINDPQFYERIGINLELDSERPVIMVPMRDNQGTTVGFFTMEFNGDQKEISKNAMLFAAFVAPAIQMAAYYEELERELRRSSKLGTAASSLQGSLTDVITQVQLLAAEISGIPRVSLLLVDMEQHFLYGRLYPKNSRGEPLKVKLRIAKRVGRMTPLMRALRSSRAILVKDKNQLVPLDTKDINEWGEWFSFQTEEGLKKGFNPFVAVPLIGEEGKKVGLLVLDSPDPGFKVHFSHVEVLAEFARIAGPKLYDAIERKRLQDMAIKDHLTGLYNRRYLEELFDTYISRMIRFNENLLVSLFDVDKFKYYNDLFDYNVGDQVLKHMAQLLKNVCRDTDTACRYGGEELMIIGTLNPNATSVDLKTMGERVREKVQATPVIISYSYTNMVKSLARMFLLFEQEKKQVPSQAEGMALLSTFKVRSIEGFQENDSTHDYSILSSKAFLRYRLTRQVNEFVKQELKIDLSTEDVEDIVDMIYRKIITDSTGSLSSLNIFDILKQFGIDRLYKGISQKLKPIIDETMFEDDERELTVTMGITVSGAVLDRTVLFKKLLPAGSRHTREQVRAAFTLKAAQGLLSQGVHMAKEGGRNRIVVIE